MFCPSCAESVFSPGFNESGSAVTMKRLPGTDHFLFLSLNFYLILYLYNLCFVYHPQSFEFLDYFKN